jgi:hypothetical protein
MYTGAVAGFTSVLDEPVVDGAESGAPVFGATDTDPQAITASIIARQDVIRSLWNIILFEGMTGHNRKCI